VTSAKGNGAGVGGSTHHAVVVARVSRKDADALAPFDRLFDKAARFLKPLMLRPPPAAGSKRPGDVMTARLTRHLVRQAELAGDRRPDLRAGALDRYPRVLGEHPDAR
jgi:hypothetical protein